MIERKKKKVQDKRAAELLAEAQKVGGSNPPTEEYPEGISSERVPLPTLYAEAVENIAQGFLEVEVDPRNPRS